MTTSLWLWNGLPASVTRQSLQRMDVSLPSYMVSFSNQSSVITVITQQNPSTYYFILHENIWNHVNIHYCNWTVLLFLICFLYFVLARTHLKESLWSKKDSHISTRIHQWTPSMSMPWLWCCDGNALRVSVPVLITYATLQIQYKRNMRELLLHM